MVLDFGGIAKPHVVCLKNMHALQNQNLQGGPGIGYFLNMEVIHEDCKSLNSVDVHKEKIRVSTSLSKSYKC